MLPSAVQDIPLRSLPEISGSLAVQIMRMCGSVWLVVRKHFKKNGGKATIVPIGVDFVKVTWLGRMARRL